MPTATDTNRYLTLAYKEGALAARQKLATMAGPIAYASRQSKEPTDYSANKRQDLWAEFDQEPFQTGEESGLGMPSASGVAKTADSGDGGYGVPGGGYYTGSMDGDSADPNRFKRMSSAMSEAFKANDDYDQSYSEESAMTQPHGSKYAAGGMGLGGITSGMPSSSTSMMGISSAPKPPQAPKMPQAPKPPGLGQRPNVTDPRGDKPPGMNLQHTLQTSVAAADSQAGFGSPQRRMMGGSV